MRIESLFLFLSVAERGSITDAARRAYISQQGASAIIKGLERELDVVLFERHGNSLSLTHAGRALADESAKVVSAYEHMLAVVAAQGEAAPDPNPLKIIATPLTLFVFTPIFNAYREATGARTPFIFEEKSIFDIARDHPRLKEDAMYIVNLPTHMPTIMNALAADFEPLVMAELMVCGSRESVLAGLSRADARHLEGQRFACFNEELLLRLATHVLKNIPNASIELKTSNIDLLSSIMAQKDMLGFTDSFSLYLDGFSLGECAVPLRESVAFATGILGGANTEEARAFAKFLRRYLATMCSAYMQEYEIPPIFGQAAKEEAGPQCASATL